MKVTLDQWAAMSPEERLFSRLDDGAGRPCLFLPFVGEFGHEVMTHLRLVHFHGASEKVVCCRPGCEVLYPSASRFVTNWHDPIPDARRVGTGRGVRRVEWPCIKGQFPNHVPIRAGGLSAQQELIIVRPGERIPFKPRLRGLKVDVVLGVRHRSFAPERNWRHWHQVAKSLTAMGLTFAVMGNRMTSEDLPGQAIHTGDHGTDAAIELLQTCKVYVGTDSGGSHLAAAVGAPMLVFRETLSGSRDLTGRMAAENPGNVEVLADGWDRPTHVVERIFSRLVDGRW